MKIEFDPTKNGRNIAKHGISFERASDFDFSAALLVEDIRRAYPERRFQALGHLDGRLHMLVFAPLPDGIRPISFRKANKREVRRYEKAVEV